MNTIDNKRALFEGAPSSYILTGLCVAQNQNVYVRGVVRALEEAEYWHTFVFRWANGVREHYTIHKSVTSQCILEDRERTVFSLCNDGAVHVSKPSASVFEHVDPTEEGPNELRWMIDIKSIGKSIFAVGMARQVYRRMAANSWIQFNQGAEITTEEEIFCGFRSIDGIDENCLYAVGLLGEIWHFNGGTWRKLDSPTNMRLDQVRYVSPELVYACGAGGTIIRGHCDSWVPVEQDVTDGNLWGMEPFDGKVYFADSTAVYVLDGEDFSKVDMKLSQPVTTSYLQAKDGVLYSLGSRDLVRFDGQSWSRCSLEKASA